MSVSGPGPVQPNQNNITPPQVEASKNQPSAHTQHVCFQYALISAISNELNTNSMLQSSAIANSKVEEILSSLSSGLSKATSFKSAMQALVDADVSLSTNQRNLNQQMANVKDPGSPKAQSLQERSSLNEGALNWVKAQIKSGQSTMASIYKDTVEGNHELYKGLAPYYALDYTNLAQMGRIMGSTAVLSAIVHASFQTHGDTYYDFMAWDLELKKGHMQEKEGLNNLTLFAGEQAHQSGNQVNTDFQDLRSTTVNTQSIQAILTALAKLNQG